MRRIVAVLVAALVVMAVPMAGPAAAVHRKQNRFVALMNEERAERGLPRLTVSSDLRAYAKSHSRKMVADQDLYHSSKLRTLSNWDMLGENVGRGGSVRALHNAFMNSQGHRENILRSNFRQVGVGVVMSGDTVYVTVVFRDPTNEASASAAGTADRLRRATAVVAHPERNGYWIVRRNGAVKAFGRARHYGSARRVKHTPIVDAFAKPNGRGYWLVSETGGVYAYGRAKFHGSGASVDMAGDVVAAMLHPKGRGYYLVTDRGGVYSFGRAPFRGAATRLDHAGIVDAVMHPSGRGYYLLDRAGGVYTFGNVPFRGSAAGLDTAGSPRAMALDPATRGYSIVSAAGGVYAFGPAGFFGSSVNGDRPPVVDATYTASGKGQWLVTSGGRILALGGARNWGSW